MRHPWMDQKPESCHDLTSFQRSELEELRLGVVPPANVELSPCSGQAQSSLQFYEARVGVQIIEPLIGRKVGG